MTKVATPALARAALIGAFAVGVVVIPFALAPAQLTVYVVLGLAVMVTSGISLLMGYAGQVSLGQGAFYALGAYAAALIALHGLPTLLGLAAAPVVAGTVALVCGGPLLRLRGHYLAFATLAFHLILLSFASDADFVGGAIGLQGIPQLSVGSATLTDQRGYAVLTWVAVMIVLLVTRNLIRSRPGRGLRALASSETAAASAGVPVGWYKLVVFAISAAYAGLAGGIYAYFVGYVASGSFPILMSVEFVVMAVVGGLGTVWGALIGATLVTVVVQSLNQLGTLPGMPAYAPSVLSYAVYAAMLILILLYLPRGILPSVRDLLTRVRASRATARAEDGAHRVVADERPEVGGKV